MNKTENLDEGDDCPHCDGKMGIAPVENCSCHISAPCGQCVDNPLLCDQCGWQEGEVLQDNDKPQDLQQLICLACKCGWTPTTFNFWNLCNPCCDKWNAVRRYAPPEGTYTHITPATGYYSSLKYDQWLKDGCPAPPAEEYKIHWIEKDNQQ